MKEINETKRKEIIDQLKASNFSRNEIEKIDDMLIFLSNRKIKKGEQIRNSIENRKSNIFMMHFQYVFQKIYQNTSKPLLPYVVWIIYEALFTVVSYLILRNNDGVKLFAGVMLWFFVAVAPLCILPISYHYAKNEDDST